MRRWNRQLVIVVALLLGIPSVAYAQFENSASYSMNESQIGGNGLFTAHSGNYSLIPPTGNEGGESLGATTGGNGSSAHYSTNAGFDTASQPGLIFNVSGTTMSLGQLSTTVPTYASTTFSVRDYTSSGYNVYLIGGTPTNGTHPLQALAAAAPYNVGAEQFGVNLVFDTGVGSSASPTCQAAGFCSGVAATNYNTNGSYRFDSGDIVASGPSSSGETDYTMTAMAGISNVTPADTYQGTLVLVATGSY
jgi:hypothetical protein